MRVESAQDAQHLGPWHTQWQGGHGGKHPGRNPVYPHSVVQAICRRLTMRVVGGDDESLVSGSAQMLENSQHRIGHTVDVGQE